MCMRRASVDSACSCFQPSRRQFLAAAGGAAGLWAAHRLVAAEHAAPGPHQPQNGQAALQRLLDGNARFARGKPLHQHENADWRRQLSAGQHPFAAIVGCSDSRVPVELIFDQGFGDLFVIRVAGNVIAADVLGSLQYAVAHLHVPLILVLGHHQCGAVTAAVEDLRGRAKEPQYITDLVKMIEPGLAAVDATLPLEKQVTLAVEANVRWSIKQIHELPEEKVPLQARQSLVAGAIYDLETGTVRVVEVDK